MAAKNARENNSFRSDIFLFCRKFLNDKNLNPDSDLGLFCKKGELSGLIKSLEDLFEISLALKKDDHKNLSTNHLAELIKQASIKKEVESIKKPIIKPAPKRPHYPLTHAQKRMWVLYMLEPDSPFYNITHARSIAGKLDKKALDKAIKIIVNRHESFRTKFYEVNGEPVQKIKSTSDVFINEVDISYISKDRVRNEKLQEIIDHEIRRPFNLKKDKLLRITLIVERESKNRPQDNRFTLVIVMHHIISDGWSMDVFYRELAEIYNSTLENKNSTPPAPLVQYKDYAVYEQSKDRRTNFAAREKYWLKQFSGELPVLNLPTDMRRSPVQTYRGDIAGITLDKRLTYKLEKIARDNETTMFMLLFAIFYVLLCRITGQRDIIVGTPGANRKISDTANIIGVFMNIFPIRIKIDSLGDEPKFIEVLKAVKYNVIQAMDNDDYPFEMLIDKLKLARDMSRGPIFNVMFQANPKYDRSIKKMNGLTVWPRKAKNRTANFDLRMLITETGNSEFRITMEYNVDLFKKESIERFLDIFKMISVNVAKSPDIGIFEIDLIEKSERKRLLRDFHYAGASYPRDKCIHQLFVARAREHPNKIALECNGKRMTYRDLDNRSDRLAAYIDNKYKLSKHEPVAFGLKRSEFIPVVIMAILKTGHPYLPLDFGYPEDRIVKILERAGCSLLICQDIYCAKFRKILNRPRGRAARIDICNIDDKDLYSNEYTIEKSRRKTKATDPAAVIFTSGSTGEPKGVELTHQGIINHVYAQKELLKINSRSTIAQNLQHFYVAANWQLFAPLLFGARQLIYPEAVARSPVELFSMANQDKVDTLSVTPSMLKVFLDSDLDIELENIKYILVGGEVVPPELVGRFYGKFSAQLINIYGQTECSDDTLHYKIPKKYNPEYIPAGKPIQNVQVYILDRHQRLTPPGVPGELYISGACLARGYINDPEKTNKAFLPHPFKSGKRIYKTGDLAKMHKDGNIEILGRVDHQIKIRGFRIEPGEIELQIKKIQGIKEVAVIKYREALAAYYTIRGKGGQTTTVDIRGYLKDVLPDYMIPSYFIKLYQMPLGRSGKLDRFNLPTPGEADFEKNEYEKPRTATEKKLSKIWQKTLNVKMISRHDDFFAIGGHSLKAIGLLSCINKEFGIAMPLKDIFMHAKLRELADRIILYPHVHRLKISSVRGKLRRIKE